MRVLLALMLLLAMALGAGLVFGEAALARRAMAVAAADPRVELAAAEPLPGLGRLGLRFKDLGLARRPDRALHLPSLDLWSSPVAPTDFRAVLPETIEIGTAAGPVRLGLAEATARLRLAPLNGLTVSDAAIDAAQVTVDGHPLAEDLAVTAKLVSLGYDAPGPARSAYDLVIDAEGVATAALSLPAPSDALPGVLSAKGGLRLWLDGAPGQGLWQGRLMARPELVGLRLDGLRLGLGGLDARLFGRIEPGKDGRAEGWLAVMTADAGAALSQAAEAGLISRPQALLAQGVAHAAAQAPLPAEPAVDWPEPEAGELRLPLILRDGEVHLGEMILGPSPHFPR